MPLTVIVVMLANGVIRLIQKAHDLVLRLCCLSVTTDSSVFSNLDVGLKERDSLQLKHALLELLLLHKVAILFRL